MDVLTLTLVVSAVTLSVAVGVYLGISLERAMPEQRVVKPVAKPKHKYNTAPRKRGNAQRKIWAKYTPEQRLARILKTQKAIRLSRFKKKGLI